MKNKVTVKKLLLVLVLFSFSCSSKEKKTTVLENKPKVEQKTNQFFTIPFAEIIKNKREVPLSEIAESVEFIQFEKTDKSLLGRISDIQITKDYIFIKHNGSPLLTQFDRSGKFIRKFGTAGRGPKEYALMRAFSIDEKNELVYIHTNWTRKILIYNFAGEYVKTLKFAAVASPLISWSRDNLLVSFDSPYSGNEPYVFVEVNENGDTTQTIENHIFWDKNESSQLIVSYWGRNVFYRFNNKLHMKSWYNDTVYTYNDRNEIIPKFFVDLKEHKIPDDQVFERKSTKPLPNECYWIGVNESSNYIFVRYGPHYKKGDKKLKEIASGCVVYNKTTKQGTALNESEMVGFTNDLTAGPNFKPRYTGDSMAFVDVSALDMKLYLNSEKFRNQTAKFPAQKEKLIQINKTLKVDDNHFLIIVKLKE